MIISTCQDLADTGRLAASVDHVEDDSGRALN
jgi:hypothetical protein